MSDRLGPGIESWLKATDLPPVDLGRAMATIEAELVTTPQRGRWWPLPIATQRLTGTGRRRGQTMFSALKIFTAGVVVALFGGLLLASNTVAPSDEVPAAVATASEPPAVTSTAEPPTDSPAATTTIATEMTGGLVPGAELLAEEVEPGVFRIVSDGVRDPSLPALGPEGFMNHPWRGDHDALLTGLDGSVWLKEGGSLTKLGARESLRLPQNPGGVVVSRDGTTWAVGGGPRLYSYDDGGRQLRFDGRDVANTIGLRLTADDDVWALLGTDRPGRYRLHHFDGSDWVKLPRPPAPADLPEGKLEAWAVGDDGTSWAIRRGLISYFDGERWTVKVPYEGDPAAFRRMPDGGVLSLGSTGDGSAVVDSFATDGSSERITVPAFGDWGEPFGPLIWTLAPDGAVWRTFVDSDPFSAGVYAPHFFDCAGLARFDGGSWTNYLRGRCVAEIEFGPDGSVWTYASTTSPGETVVADGSVEGIPAGTKTETLVDGPLELYVITPEAVSGS